MIPYRKRGIVGTRGELEKVDPLSDHLVGTDVRWPGLDKDGRESSTERSHDILQQDEKGRLHIRVAMARIQ